MKNIIIVTGGAGFIGTNLIKLLLKKTNYNIISVDNYSAGSKKNHLNNKRIKYLNFHTKDISKKLYILRKKIIVVFHFGEFSRIFQSFNQISKCFDSNILGTSEVLKFCNQNKIKIIYSATSASLGNGGNDQHLSPYAWSKAKNLDLIFNYSKWFGLKYEVIFFYNVYGPYQILKGKMAAVIGIFQNNFKKNKYLPIVKQGRQRRNFTHVSDTVEVCYNAWKSKKNSCYLVCAKEKYSILQIANFFKHKYKFIKERPGERYKSNKVNSIRGKKIITITGKINIKKYIKDFIK